jgi:hypothetical protein
VSHDLLQRPATLERIHLLQERAGLPAEAHEAAVRALTPTASTEEWRNAIDSALLWLGAAQLVAGVVYGVAWNAAAIGPMSWLLVLQLVFLGVIGLAIWRGPDDLMGRTAGVSALFLIGPQLALVGQTYQTGANSWLLFAWWAAFGLPLVLGSRSAWGWVSWTVIVTTAAVLWVPETTRHWDPKIGWLLLGLAGLLPLLTSLSLQVAAHRWPWAESTGAQRTLLTLHLIPWGISAAALATGFFPDHQVALMVSMLLLGATGMRYGLLYNHGGDPFGAGLGGFMLLAASTSFLAAHLIDHRLGAVGVMLVGALILVQGIALTIALRAALAQHKET